VLARLPVVVVPLVLVVLLVDVLLPALVVLLVPGLNKEDKLIMKLTTP
jgi:hypothetical protein